VVAMVCGALMGHERELAGKEAGVRTEMLVSGGASLFTLIALNLPYILSDTPETSSAIFIHNAGVLSIIANIVVGIGFLGAGIIIKNQSHVFGLTTAALVWTTGAIGVLVGLGMFEIAIASSILFSGVLYLLRRMNIAEVVEAVRD
ncbi:MAG: MgtC/SapB family protein, partial [Patescibacteria group bacterium]